MREVDQEVTSLLEPPPSTGPDPPMADSPPPLLLASDWWSGDGRVPGGSLVDGGIEGVPWSAIQADFMQASLEASPPIAMSASHRETGWWYMVAVLEAFLSAAYLVDSSRGRWLIPLALAATSILVLLMAPMATLKHAPLPSSTSSSGTTTSSQVMPLVSDALWPMVISFLSG